MLEWRFWCDGWKSTVKKPERITGGIRYVVQNELEKLTTLCGKYERSSRIEVR